MTLYVLTLLAGFILYSSKSYALNYLDIVVANVGAKFFSVIWQTDEAAEPALKLYADVLRFAPIYRATIPPPS